MVVLSMIVSAVTSRDAFELPWVHSAAAILSVATLVVMHKRLNRRAEELAVPLPDAVENAGNDEDAP